MHRERHDRPVKDPVCGMAVSKQAAVTTYKYGGKTYYFCADCCRDNFAADPERYVGARRRRGRRPVR
jgi:YHS domain-containing protein